MAGFGRNRVVQWRKEQWLPSSTTFRFQLPAAPGTRYACQADFGENPTSGPLGGALKGKGLGRGGGGGGSEE